MDDHTKQLENEDAIDKLFRNGWGGFCNVLMHDETVRFKTGKINMSRLSQKMGWTVKATTYALKRLKELLEAPC